MKHHHGRRRSIFGGGVYSCSDKGFGGVRLFLDFRTKRTPAVFAGGFDVSRIREQKMDPVTEG